MKASVSSDIAGLSERVVQWMQQKMLPLNRTANAVLLPSGENPDRDLFRTHLLHVEIKEDLEASRGFTAKSVDIMPIEKVFKRYPDLKTDFNRVAAQHVRQAEISAALPDKGKHYAGTVYVLVDCAPLVQCSGIVISCEMIDQRKTYRDRPDWKKSFMDLIDMHRYYENGVDLIGVPEKVFPESERLLRAAK